MTPDPNEKFWQELCAFDAAYDESWPDSSPPDFETLNASIIEKLGFTTPTPQVSSIIAQANIDYYRAFDQQQIIQSCRLHDQLNVLQQNGYVLVGSDYYTDQLIYPSPHLTKENLWCFIAEMWGQWVEVPINGWEIAWELEVVSDTDCVLHPYILSFFSLSTMMDPADEVYVLHEIITEALGLDLISVSI